RDTIFKEIAELATKRPSEDEMAKLRNNLFNGAVRSRQSSLFRSQQIAEFALYDGDPELFNTDLQNYLDVTAQQVREAVADYLNPATRLLLEIAPARAEIPAAAPQPPGEPTQPTAPPAQVPSPPPREPAPSGPLAAERSSEDPQKTTTR